MKDLISQSLLRYVLIFGLTTLTNSLQAVQNFTENINIGTTDANKILTVNGASNLKDLTTIGTSSTNANLKVWGDTSVCGNTTVNEKDCCKCIFGLIENFNPHDDQLSIQFCNTEDENHGAFVQLHFCSICTNQEIESAVTPVTTIAKGFYLHPNDAEKCFDVNGLTRINEADGNTTLDVGCKLDLIFRKNNLDRMCVGLFSLDHTTTETTFYQSAGTHVYDPGCLFYKITSCNLMDVKVTATEDLNFDLLSETIENLIAQVTSDEDQQEDIADVLISFGPDFLELFEALDEESQLAILNVILGDLSLGQTSNIMKIKECMRMKDRTKMVGLLKSIRPTKPMQLKKA